MSTDAPLFLDCYDAHNCIICRFKLLGTLGAVTGGSTSQLASFEADCVKVGMWGSRMAEKYVQTAGSTLSGKISPSAGLFTLTAKSIQFLNMVFTATSDTTSSASRSGGCWCGAWLGGGVHLDYCAPHLAGKACGPYMGP